MFSLNPKRGKVIWTKAFWNSSLFVTPLHFLLWLQHTYQPGEEMHGAYCHLVGQGFHSCLCFAALVCASQMKKKKCVLVLSLNTAWLNVGCIMCNKWLLFSLVKKWNINLRMGLRSKPALIIPQTNTWSVDVLWWSQRWEAVGTLPLVCPSLYCRDLTLFQSPHCSPCLTLAMTFRLQAMIAHLCLQVFSLTWRLFLFLEKRTFHLKISFPASPENW